MFMIVFSKKNGQVLFKTSGCQTLREYTKHFPENEALLLDSLYLKSEDIPKNYKDYIVIDGELVLMPSVDIESIRKHGRILTPDERLIESLKPSIQEIQKAESEIEILTLLNEVDVI